MAPLSRDLWLNLRNSVKPYLLRLKQAFCHGFTAHSGEAQQDFNKARASARVYESSPTKLFLFPFARSGHRARPRCRPHIDKNSLQEQTINIPVY